MTEATESATPTREEFARLLEEDYLADMPAEGSVVRGRVVAIENDYAIIDVGLKTEGRVPLKEFVNAGEEINVGDEVEVYLERIENALGEAVLSRDKARREEAWERLEEAYGKGEPVTGQIFGRVKGGFTVDLGGAVAFLPGSQVDIRPIRDITPLLNVDQPFKILKMDRRRGNIVVSRRAILEESRAEQRAELVQNLKEGQVVEGMVKNITDYGAFVDLGGIDGLLHVTDMSWKRVSHPSDILSVGDTVKVQIIKINKETQRISLGMKQLQEDPWKNVVEKYPVGTRVKGRVTNITDYGAFVELEEGVEGLVHVSEMSWTKKNVHPGKILSTSQEIEVQVLDVDPQRRRISLGLKQTQENPWDTFEERYPPGTEVEGEIKNITEFGMFIGLEGDVDGMVHLSDLSWDRPGEEVLKEYRKGQVVKAVVLGVDRAKERISLGIKQLGGEPLSKVEGLRKGATVTVEVTEVKDSGIEVQIVGTDVKGFIRRSDLAKDRSEQRPDRFAPGERVDAKVTSIDRAHQKVGLSIRALEIEEEKKALEQFGSTAAGASLGEILKAAMEKKEKKDDEGDDAAE
ncbi:MAG TPA: 30S ribosomal protein S1 [Thermopetrobacter sp.]|nr:30S ribosomal protein S1 [Thermopetrobacter sp.]